MQRLKMTLLRDWKTEVSGCTEAGGRSTPLWRAGGKSQEILQSNGFKAQTSKGNALAGG